MVAIQTVGLLVLLAFFVCDFFSTKVLNRLKAAHPELEECAPADSPDLDTAAVLESLASTAVDMYQQQQQRGAGAIHDGGATGRAYEHLDTLPASAVANPTVNPLHTTVVVCGLAAPALVLLRLLLPWLTGWTVFSAPAVLATLGVFAGLAVTALYGARVFGSQSLTDVTTTDWIAMMWVRIDFMFIMGVAALCVGAWVVALCMVGVAAYMAHRVMRIEKQLTQVQRSTQLLRGEVDVTRVFVPGTAESKQAMGESAGYSSLN